MRVLPSSAARSLAFFASVVFTAAVLAADEKTADADPPVAFKFTSGLYQLRSGGQSPAQALDLNLRATSGFGNVWIGQFRSPAQAITQTRFGWDHSFDLGALRLQPSLEVASGGYVGGSAYIETGKRWFAGAGLSRTNLQNFVNLNFDPGDSYTLAGGYRWADNASLTLQRVRDNRLNPDQQNLHVVWRSSVVGGQRLTLDGLYKTGLVSGTSTRVLGLSVVYDWPHFFVHAAWDPKVNFTPQDMFRLSVGTRF